MKKILLLLVLFALEVVAPAARADQPPEPKTLKATVCDTTGRNPFAVDVFVHADHFKKSSKLNEKNWGLGFKYYCPDTLFNSGGEFFGEIGGLRNSQKGEAYFIGGGYTKKLFEINGVRISGSIAPTFVDYGAKGRSATARVILPFVSVGYGHWDSNIVYFGKHDGGFLLFTAQYRF